MTRPLGWTVLALLAACPTALPEGAESTPPPVGKLIEQLGSRDFKTREAANKALAIRGPDALAAMRKAQPHPDAEVRKRLEQIIGDTERAALLAPKRVTLKLDGVSIKDALSELSRVSGYRIDLQGGNPQQVVSLDVKNMTFWQALDLLSSQAGLVLQQHHDMTGGLILYAQNATTPFVDYRGPFRVWATGFHYNKSLMFGSLPRSTVGGQRTEQLSFMFSVVSEPKLPLLGLGQAKLAVAIDDQDNSLILPAGNRGVYESYHSGYYGYRNLVLQTQVQLVGQGANARSVKHIKGVLPVTLLTEQRADIVVTDILNVKEKKFEGKDVSLEIAEVKEAQGKTYQIAMTARRAGKDAPNDYTWTNSLHQRVELTDAKGNKFQSHGFNWTNGTPTSVQGTFIFGDGGNAQVGKPHKLTYYGWVTAQHQIEFEFRDLPLP